MSKTTTAPTMKGNPVTLLGKEIEVGQTAPDASLVANDLSTFNLSSLKGKKIILSARSEQPGFLFYRGQYL